MKLQCITGAADRSGKHRAATEAKDKNKPDDHGMEYGMEAQAQEKLRKLALFPFHGEQCRCFESAVRYLHPEAIRSR